MEPSKKIKTNKSHRNTNTATRPLQGARRKKLTRRPRSINEKPIIVLFNKPFGVLCQFTDEQNRQTLKDYIPIKEVYAAGRLDHDSEGLVLLTNDGRLQSNICEPKTKIYKSYWVQVEGVPTKEAIDLLTKGVELKDGKTLPAKVDIITPPDLWPRHPPIRQRKNIPTTWLAMHICEGRNRQIRRMTAHVGYPALRLIRYKIGQWQLDGIDTGTYRLSDLM